MMKMLCITLHVGVVSIRSIILLSVCVVHNEAIKHVTLCLIRK